jgi:hypothetical protein
MDIINFNKEILIDELQKYYTNTNLNSLKYFYNNKYYKFNKLTNYSLNINKYVNGIVITNDFILSKTNTILTVCKVIRNKKTLNYGFIYGTIKDNSVNNLFTLLSLSSVSKDGEYKHNLLNFKYIDFLFKK